MIDSIGFGNPNDLIWVLIITTGLFALFSYFEVKGSSAQPKGLRITVTAILLISLALSYLQPYYYTDVSENLTLIFTNGEEKRDSLVNKHPGVNQINWSDTLNPRDLTQHLIIDGYGVPAYDLWKLENKQIQYLPPKAPKGIVAFHYPEQVNVQEQVDFQFKVNGYNGAWLKLNAFGEVVDSVQVPDNPERLTLQYTSNVAGNYVFSVVLTNRDNTAEISEPLPIKIKPLSSRKVLILNIQPTFESRFLKNHLVDQGHSVFVRSEITENRFSYENIGIERSRLSRLNREVLREFDILIAAQNVVEDLRNSEKNALRLAVSEDGLGVHLVANTESQRKLPTWLRFKRNNTNLEGEMEVQLLGKTINIDMPTYALEVSKLTESFLQQDELVLGVRRPVGSGMVSTTALSGTYKIALGGNKTGYDGLWSHVINNLLMDGQPPIKLEQKIVKADLPVSVHLMGNDDATILKYEGTPISLRQNEFVPGRWNAIFWPKGTGWQNLNYGDYQHGFYVMKPAAWQSMEYAQRINLNKSLITQSDRGEEVIKKVSTSISLWWFYLLFILSATYLWLEPKLR